MTGRKYLRFSFFVFCCMLTATVFSQPTWTFDPFGNEKKPEQYEDKKLGSEKTADKKFTVVRRIIQDNVSHYNYYFNANNKLNAVIERAKLSQKDNYSKLLSFYPYELDNTASQQQELDSVIYKATGGILLHDLRTDWVDNFYLLIGKSYYYRKLFDSAALTFQFINYNLFPRKKHEDDSRTVGANASSTSHVLSIADEENRNLIDKAFTLPPSRNDALLWLARTFIEQEEYGDAAGMINILQVDPALPKRLKDDLDDVAAYWFFKQKIYDSAAVYLEKALSNFDSKADVAREQYLLGQLFELSGKYDKASVYFVKAAKHTTDPLMDIYSHLNEAKMLRDSGNYKEIFNSIDALVKMAKKDKYEPYRDIIYHSAAMLAMKKKDTVAGVFHLTKSLFYNENNPDFKNKAHLELGKIAYEQKQYKNAADHYDSLDLSNFAIYADSAENADRKYSLRKIADELSIIENEDSLQMVAAMPPAQRDALIKKLIKANRKSKGGIVEDDFSGNTIITSFNNRGNEPSDLFQAPLKGDWYFNNATLKSKGFSDFRSNWGKRENKDNWRRKSALDFSKNLNENLDLGTSIDDPLAIVAADNTSNAFTYDALMSNLPLTPGKLDSSNQKIETALLDLAKLFELELQDYQQAVYTYDISLQRFPSGEKLPAVYLGMYHCYTKLGDFTKAAYYKNLLDTGFPDSKYAAMINHPATMQADKRNPVVAAKYQEIYEKFIEGDFETAITEKKQADSLYGKNYWTPQLLYIEAVHYIKAQQDSEAIAVLTNLDSLYPGSAMGAKAVNLIKALRKRAETEAYLNNLQITRAEEPARIIMSNDKVIEPTKLAVTAAPIKNIQPINTIPINKDAAVQLPPSMVSGVFKWQPTSTHSVIMILDKVDVVYVNEAKNAFTRYNRDKNFSTVVISKDALDPQRSILVFNSFADAGVAVDYFDKIKKAASTEVSWLQSSKYYFLVISESNLQLLKSTKDIDSYKKLLNTQYPGKF